MNELVLYAALVNWITTTILVESNLFAPMRYWFTTKALRLRTPDGKLHKAGNLQIPAADIGPDGIDAYLARVERTAGGPWVKPAQLVTCIMCLGTWVGFAQAAFLGGPIHGWYAVIVNGLLYKAGGHLIYEVRSRVAKVDPPQQQEVQFDVQ